MIFASVDIGGGQGKKYDVAFVCGFDPNAEESAEKTGIENWFALLFGAILIGLIVLGVFLSLKIIELNFFILF